MAELPKLNEVAYVRFASVYRKFRDISSFERELYQDSREQRPNRQAKSAKNKLVLKF